MIRFESLLPLLGALAALAAGCATRPAEYSYPEVSALPRKSDMPDPLVAQNGQRVATNDEWFKQRRPELQGLFEHYMYGKIPVVPTTTTVLGQYADFLGGKATLKLIRLEAGGGANALKIDLMLVVPNQRTSPAPVFLALNFCGNHTLTPDPRVPLASGWIYDWCKGVTNHAATEAARGAQAADWPLERIVERGYALASFYNGNIDSDRQDVSEGLYALLAGNDPRKSNPTNRGTIAAWAWGFHACVDYLVKDPDVDAKKIAALGHSRNGKAALLAAAFDERIAIAFPHQAGCGGSAPSRGKTGESVKAINDRFPHWFNAKFKEFNEAPELLPFDQNGLVALCAPRPVLFSAAQEDQWANPKGQFEVLRAADPVYRFLGVEGFAAEQVPPNGQLVGRRLGYYIREGKHSMTANDWEVFMDFADKQFGREGVALKH
jgi:hypothetical protein